MTEIKPFIDMEGVKKIGEYVAYMQDQKALPAKFETPAQYLQALQAGAEMGMTRFEAEAGLSQIKGIITIYGPVAVNQMRKWGYDWERLEVADRTKEAKILVWKGSKENPERGPIEEKYTIAEAQLAGLLYQAEGKPKGPRIKHPVDMLRYKCLARVRKHWCPEVNAAVPMHEDYVGMDSNQTIDISEERTIHDKINACETIQELEAIKLEVVSKAKDDKTVMATYREAQQKLSAKSLETPVAIVDEAPKVEENEPQVIDASEAVIQDAIEDELIGEEDVEARSEKDEYEGLEEEPQDSNNQEQLDAIKLMNSLEEANIEITKKLKDLTSGEPEYKDLFQQRLANKKQIAEIKKQYDI